MPPGEWVPIGEIQIETEADWWGIEEIARSEAYGMKADALVVISNQALSTTYSTTGSGIVEGRSTFYYGNSVSTVFNQKLVVLQALRRNTGETGQPPPPSP
jgi:hypothetical protein